jgi:ComF family protein
MLLDLLFPKNCFECKKPGRYICQECLRKVGKAKLVCPECRRASFEGKTHLFCKSKLSLDGMHSFYAYDGVLRKAILALKYRFIYSVAEEIVNSLNFSDMKFDSQIVLLPIPLHIRRERWRGFNQAEILGKLISKKNSWEFKTDVLLRLENTIPQVKLGRAERVRNIRGKFAVNTGFIPDPNKIYVVFDDVWTTGSTISEACKVLKKAGAKEVWGMSVART